MVHFYIGDGKGKTTAALGLAVRAAGCKRKVYIGQFLKSQDVSCSELDCIKQIKISIKAERFPYQSHPMFCRKDRPFDMKKLKDSTRQALLKIEHIVKKKSFDVVVLDEILNSVKGKVCSKAVLKRIIKKSKGIELVLTGRTASKDLIDLADYVSFIKKVKHPFDKGIIARRGIEY